MAWKAAVRGERRADPMWFTFSALAIGFATILAAVWGDMNFWYNTQPFLDLKSLLTYNNLNPATTKGQRSMDAGIVYFSKGTHLDGKKAMAFKNLDTYCVAPIVNEGMTMYDFWAVGTNCCAEDAADFRCGDYKNKHAGAGVRMLSDDQRPFYRLAVQQAESQYDLKAPHPLFFYYVQDPIVEEQDYQNRAFKSYLQGVFAHFAFNLCCVVLAIYAFSNIGTKWSSNVP